MITVVPEGGLCNRLRVVASCWLLAQACGQPMRVLWYRAPDFNARFDALFDLQGLPFAIVEAEALSRPARALALARSHLVRWTGAVVLGNAETAPGVFSLAEAVPSLRAREVFIRTNSRLVARPGMYDLFRPVGLAAERLAALRPRLAGSVGVHVRRTDNARAAQVSTLDRFIDLMRDEQQAMPGVRFFVATDDPEVLATLRREFGDAAWEHPKRAYARDDPAAIIDAVVDLYALAACRRLIGSYWSSFTDTAAELHGIPCVVARAAVEA